MSLFNMFSSNDPAPAAAPTATPVAPTAAPATPVAAEPGSIPAAVDPNALPPTGDPTVAPVAEPVDDSPLAAFNTLWDTDPNKAEPAATVQSLDPTKLKETIAKSDFSSVISQENLAAIQAGGDEATGALTSSMNEVAQLVMNQSLLASNKMIEQAVDQVNSAWEAKLPELLRKQSLNDNLVSADPLFKNPAIKPIMEATQQQLASKYPDATVAELQTMTQDYIKAMGEAFSPKPVTPANSAEASTDWDKFMSP